MNAKPVILILIGCLWPGNDSAGPSLSIRALCEALHDRFDFRLVARDRAFGAAAPLVGSEDWHDTGFARIHFLKPGRFGTHGLIALLRETSHDLLILNGFFDQDFTLPTLFARLARRGSKAPVLLSPRGEFTGGALSLKSGRKGLFRKFARAFGLHRGVHIHATSEAELADCRAAMPDNPVTLVPNFRPLFKLPDHVPRREGAPIRLAFLGRISKVKGLDTAIAALARADCPATLDIYGPVGDTAHWEACQSAIAALPPHIRAIHHGEIANADAPAMLAAHDALLLPSLSENFGHAIFEALASGTPVIIGDQTPWRWLEATQAGFDLPVGDVEAFAGAIRKLSEMGPGEAILWRTAARARAEAYLRENAAADAMAGLFETLIRRANP